MKFYFPLPLCCLKSSHAFCSYFFLPPTETAIRHCTKDDLKKHWLKCMDDCIRSLTSPSKELRRSYVAFKDEHRERGKKRLPCTGELLHLSNGGHLGIQPFSVQLSTCTMIWISPSLTTQLRLGSGNPSLRAVHGLGHESFGTISRISFYFSYGATLSRKTILELCREDGKYLPAMRFIIKQGRWELKEKKGMNIH